MFKKCTTILIKKYHYHESSLEDHAQNFLHFDGFYFWIYIYQTAKTFLFPMYPYPNALIYYQYETTSLLEKCVYF